MGKRLCRVQIQRRTPHAPGGGEAQRQSEATTGGFAGDNASLPIPGTLQLKLDRDTCPPDGNGLILLDAQERTLQPNLKGRDHRALSKEKPSLCESPARSAIFHWPPTSPLTSNRL